MTVRTRRGRAALWVLLSVWAGRCGDAADQGRGPVAIPRRRLINPADRLAVTGMDYDPVDAPLAFTPSGELLVAHMAQYTSDDVYSGVCAGSGFYAVPLAGGPPRPLAVGRQACRAVRSDGGMAANADAASVVFSESVPPNNSRLARLNLSTGRVDTLPTGCRVYLEHPSASPDGRAIAAVGLCRDRQQETYALYTLRADGSQLRVVGADSVAQFPATWSPDGRRLAYVHGPELTPASIVVIGADGTGARVLTAGTAPAWSPDGRWIAFVHQAGRWNRELHLIRPDGTDRRVIFANRERGSFSRGWGPIPEGMLAGSPLWSPDSRSVLFARRYDAGTSIWRVDAESGIVKQITRPGR